MVRLLKLPLRTRLEVDGRRRTKSSKEIFQVPLSVASVERFVPTRIHNKM